MYRPTSTPGRYGALMGATNGFRTFFVSRGVGDLLFFVFVFCCIPFPREVGD